MAMNCAVRIGWGTPQRREYTQLEALVEPLSTESSTCGVL
jgi:hypothetical protein